MAIHGPRKDLDYRGRKVEQTFYDTLTKKQKENWKEVIALQVAQMGGSAYFVKMMPEYLLKDAINNMHKRIQEESAAIERGEINE